MIFSLISYIFSAFFLFYYILLLIISPDPFLVQLKSFSNTWLLLSIFFGILPTLKKKKFFKKFSKRFKIIFFSICGFFLIIFLINFIQILNPKFTKVEHKPDYVILLGGGITKDMKLTKMVQERVKTCAEYLKSNPDSICVASGGKLPFMPCSEGEILKPALEKYGIEENRIFAECNAQDTIENLIYSVRLISKEKNISTEEVLNSNITIITTDFHIARAEKLALKMGFKNISSVKAKTPLLFRLNSYSREILAYLKLNLRILFTGKPNLNSI